eukprot:30862-Pelagococcus_subviridis.AAC.4
MKNVPTGPTFPPSAVSNPGSMRSGSPVDVPNPNGSDLTGGAGVGVGAGSSEEDALAGGSSAGWGWVGRGSVSGRLGRAAAR